MQRPIPSNDLNLEILFRSIEMRTENNKREEPCHQAYRKNRRRALLDHLKQVLWALFLVYIILFGLVFLFGKEVGYEILLWAGVSVAGLVTIVFGSIYLFDLIRILLTDQIHRRGDNYNKNSQSRNK